MTTIAPSQLLTEFNNVTVWQWSMTHANQTLLCDPVSMPLHTDVTVHARGTWGSTPGSVQLMGSIDGTNYQVLTDHAGNALTFTADSIKSVQESCIYYKAKHVTDDAALAVTLTIKGTNSQSQ